MMRALSEAYHKILNALERFASSEPDNEALRGIVGEINSWLEKYTLPPSCIPALVGDLTFYLEGRKNECVTIGLACALAKEIAAVMGAYCNSGTASLPNFYRPKNLARYRYTLVLFDNTGRPDIDEMLAAIPDEVKGLAQILVIGNGVSSAETDASPEILYVPLPNALGYAQIFAMLSSLCLGDVVMVSDNRACPDERSMKRMLEEADTDRLYFYTAAPMNSDEMMEKRSGYFDPCPPWRFQLFPGTLLEAGISPDALLGSPELFKQDFIERLREAGGTVLTYPCSSLASIESALPCAAESGRADLWRFLKITGREPLIISDSALIAKALATLSKPGKALIAIERRTTLYSALRKRVEDLGITPNWLVYDRAVEMDIFFADVAIALGKEKLDYVIIGIPANGIHNFEALLCNAASALAEGGVIWYYDENPFFVGRIAATLADEMFAERPNKCPLTLFFRKRLRDTLFNLDLDLSFERYRPPLDKSMSSRIECLRSLFSDKKDLVGNNLSTKLYFCSATKQGGDR